MSASKRAERSALSGRHGFAGDRAREISVEKLTCQFERNAQQNCRETTGVQLRSYASLSPMFWTRGSGKRLRGHMEAQIVALYLMSAPATNMVGIYHLAMPTLCHETGLSVEAASKGLARCIEEGFCFWDEGEELVFVPALAKHQIGEKLSAKDYKVKGILRALAPFKSHRFYAMFIDRYADSYCLTHEDAEAPSKPLPGDYDPDPVLSCSDPDQGSDAREPEPEPKSEPPKPLALEPAPPKTRRKRQTRVEVPETEISDDWQPTAEHAERAARDGLNLTREADKFFNNAKSKRLLAVNWNAKFTTWLIQAVEFLERDGRRPSSPGFADPAERQRQAQGEERRRREAERERQQIEAQTAAARERLAANGQDREAPPENLDLSSLTAGIG